MSARAFVYMFCFRTHFRFRFASALVCSRATCIYSTSTTTLITHLAVVEFLHPLPPVCFLTRTPFCAWRWAQGIVEQHMDRNTWIATTHGSQYSTMEKSVARWIRNFDISGIQSLFGVESDIRRLAFKHFQVRCCLAFCVGAMVHPGDELCCRSWTRQLPSRKPSRRRRRRKVYVWQGTTGNQ